MAGEASRAKEFQRGTAGVPESVKEGATGLHEGSDIGLGCGDRTFKSCHSDHLKTSLLIQSDVRKTSELSGVFLYPCTNFGLQSHISTLEIYKTPLS